MVESSKGHLEEFEDDEEVGTNRGKSREKNRSKHSETEQRRRSKINERFQLLRDLIPLNDQKRDKASFLLEVIEYIQFLQEKLNTYESPYQGWSSEPRKLIPWKNDHIGTEGFSDVDQISKNGMDRQHSTTVSPSTMLHNPQSSLEPDIGSAMVYKTLDHLSGSASLSGPLSVQQSNVFGLPSQTLRESGSGIAPVDPESWQAGNSSVFVPNNTPTSREEINEPVGISNSLSRGVLETLTQALQSSGVNMSQSSISVQIDVANPTENGFTSISSGSKNNVNGPLENQQKASSRDKYERAHKRLRVDQ